MMLIFLFLFYPKTQWDASGPLHSLREFLRTYYAALGNTPTAVTKTNESLPVRHYPQGPAALRLTGAPLGGAVREGPR